MESGGGASERAGHWGTNKQSEPSQSRLQSAMRFSESFVLDEVKAIRRWPAGLPSDLYTTGLTGAGGDNAAEPAPPQHVAADITGKAAYKSLSTVPIVQVCSLGGSPSMGPA